MHFPDLDETILETESISELVDRCTKTVDYEKEKETEINDNDEFEKGTWETCVVDDDYEIFSEYPYQIRRKRNQRIISEYLDESVGYVRCYLNRIKYDKHRIIATQFIPNTHNLPWVDHKNRNKLDNRIENLRFVTVSENNRNRNGYILPYEIIEEIHPEAIVVESYSRWKFDDLYYHDDKFWVPLNEDEYRALHVIREASGCRYVHAFDINGVRRKISLRKFKREYDLE